MPVNELERVKQDIATIKEAAGLELPFGWDSVWANLIQLPCCAVLLMVSLLIIDTPYFYMMVVPWILLFAVGVYLRCKNTRDTGRSAIRRRKYALADYGFIIIALAIMLIFMVLAKDDTVYLYSGLLTVVGLMATLVAIHSRAKLSDLGMAIPMILAGIFLAIWPSLDSPLGILGVVCFVAGPAMAFIMMYQLKQAGKRNDAH